ncbi:glutamate racemase [Candidatus Curtissbacteria bacterium RIFCSPLOWO2_02_FULL_40_11]|uniref:Glutamate racemase n=2 Tax=Candidatus Curtissiibacteriota TaxID=1752717 RepID=A0A1F5G7Y5_9BACT|nr:MAG: glutamate racemase [Candidatus Curtissbacteria bacterium RIFCSPHIGHO2_02_FULL_40_16b]OGE01531.1 MAG: glutamate racemase [Candidatus Curtissbacteria bacterium RIFCSPLOWO2_02_FULL_40_11]OGE13865.1 MAG: glutamate racemase [Candidatus Curtissbacteria bacterium RIFCSPLOWO2_12_FULL_38_9]
MADNRPIGLFDSGVGGLSVLCEIKKVLPRESFIYLADQKNVPYGTKSKKVLNNLTLRITKFLLKFDIKMLVVACNTASCYSVDFLRNNFNLPIVGVVPAVKPAVKLSKKGKITIMSTSATAKSTYLKNLIAKFSSAKNVLSLGCDGLEDSVENLNYKKINSLLDEYVKRANSFESDVIILGCTHFPFLKNDIQKRAIKGTKIIDSGKAIASRVKFLLKQNNMIAAKKTKDLFFTTLNRKKFSNVASTLLKYKVLAQKASI